MDRPSQNNSRLLPVHHCKYRDCLFREYCRWQDSIHITNLMAVVVDRPQFYGKGLIELMKGQMATLEEDRKEIVALLEKQGNFLTILGEHPCNLWIELNTPLEGGGVGSTRLFLEE